LGLGAVFVVGGLSYYVNNQGDTLHRERSFFGVCKVTTGTLDGHSVHRLVHGSTLHGIQAQDPDLQREATTYYHRTGPLGDIMRGVRLRRPDKIGDVPVEQAVRQLATARAMAASTQNNGLASLAFLYERIVDTAYPPLPLGVIGLGTGTVATYAEPGQEIVYFEIDPAMVRIARDLRLFSFLADAEKLGARLRIVLGDGRVQLAQEPDGHFGIIVIDAFSSDAIPAHLITREAVQTYLKKLAPGGVLAFHISNRYLDLQPVLGNLAQDAGLVAIRRSDGNSFGLKTGSEWVAVARDVKDLRGIWKLDPLHTVWNPVVADPNHRLWTDDYNNLLDVYNWRSDWKDMIDQFFQNTRKNLGFED
jgi:SAM-dependent methyltransferase